MSSGISHDGTREKLYQYGELLLNSFVTSILHENRKTALGLVRARIMGWDENKGNGLG